MTSALTPNSFSNMQLNAGVFLLNFDHSQYKTVETLKAAIKTAIEAGTDVLGATRGGGTFSVSKETREIEADGKRASFKGSTIIDSVNASLTGTALEFKPSNIKAIMSTGEVTDTEDGKVHTIKMRNYLKDEDYLQKLCWVGDIADGSMILIAFDNALNTSDVNFTFTDKGEGTLPFEFHAYQEDVTVEDYAPFEVVILDK